jgi:DNA-binding CsgD family transcriptional regulator
MAVPQTDILSYRELRVLRALAGGENLARIDEGQPLPMDKASHLVEDLKSRFRARNTVHLVTLAIRKGYIGIDDMYG